MDDRPLETNNVPGLCPQVPLIAAQPQAPMDFLETVKREYSGRPDVYQAFVEVMRQFRARELDTRTVAESVRGLFADRPALYASFSAFLPDEYVVQAPPQMPGAQQLATAAAAAAAAVPALQESEEQQVKAFVKCLREGLRPFVYAQLIEVLNGFMHRLLTPSQVAQAVTSLLASEHPQLLAGFRNWLPDSLRGQPLPPSQSPIPLHSPQPLTQQPLAGMVGQGQGQPRIPPLSPEAEPDLKLLLMVKDQEIANLRTQLEEERSLRLRAEADLAALLPPKVV